MHTHSMRAASTDANVSLFAVSKQDYRGKDRRRHKRVPRSVGITVELLDSDQLLESDPHETKQSFFAITRDIGLGGLAFLSPVKVTADLVMLAVDEDPFRGVVSRVCGCCLIHQNEIEKVYLTSVEFLYERFC